MDPANASEGDTVASPLVVKSCLNCRHGGYNQSLDRTCNRPFQSTEPYVFRACRTERAPDGACGIEGKFFDLPFRPVVESYYDRFPLPEVTPRPPAQLGPRTAPRTIRPITWRTPTPPADIPVFDFGFGLSTFEKCFFAVVMGLVVGSLLYCTISFQHHY